MLIALTHTVSPSLAEGGVTFIDRQTVDYDLALQQHTAYCNALEKCGVEVKRLSVNPNWVHPTYVMSKNTQPTN
ncbi:hypothetical protein IFO70_40070 [Phormidium tenue FACHB-886]|nr:hypothetical protein [Phormidium tenue FACHB-886]